MAAAKRTAKERREEKALADLRKWLASTAGKKGMRAAAVAAQEERDRLARSVRVPSDLLRARVTI